MTNKKTFVSMYQEKLNKDKNYEEVLGKVTYPKGYWKIAYSCLTVAICTILLLGTKSYLKNIDKPLKTDIIEVNPLPSSIEDFEISTDGAYGILELQPNQLLLNNIAIPKDFKSGYSTKVIYKDVHILNNYELYYQSEDGTRSITISFSSEYKPLNNYHLSIGNKSKINGFELRIYGSNTSYITEFTYNQTNYLIKTKNITESELINLLKSIIKKGENK